MLKADRLAQMILFLLLVLLVLNLKLSDGKSISTRVADAFKAAGK